MKISFTDNYKNKAEKAFKTEFKLNNNLSIPKITKVCINSGIGRLAAANEGSSETLIKDFADKLARISGQKPKSCKAKQSIAGFKLREGTIVGLNVTLRGKKMADFIDKLINITLPRTRDF
jgi:large subunit ribosomal protein L5